MNIAVCEDEYQDAQYLIEEIQQRFPDKDKHRITCCSSGASLIEAISHVSAMKRSEKLIYMQNGVTIPISRDRINEVFDEYMSLVGDFI